MSKFNLFNFFLALYTVNKFTEDMKEEFRQLQKQLHHMSENLYTRQLTIEEVINNFNLIA